MAPGGGKESSEAERKLAVKLKRQGKSSEEIAKLLGRTKRWVDIWWERERKPGQTQFKNKKRSGRPTKLTAADKAQITALMKDKPSRSHRKVSKLLNNSDRNKARGFTICPNTIVNYVRKQPWGKTSFKVQAFPCLNDEQKELRKTICRNWIRRGFADDSEAGKKLRHGIMWTDESWIELFPTPNRQNERVRTERREDVPVKRTIKNSPKILVAGAMTAHGVSELHIVPQKTTITGQYYREQILEKVYEPCLRNRNVCPNPESMIFQQDGATPHTANLSQQWCEQKFPNFWKKDEWPGNSPDLNVIEKLWAILKERVYEPPYCTTRDQLIARVKKCWHEIPQDTLRALVDGYWVDRVRKVFECNGDNNFK